MRRGLLALGCAGLLAGCQFRTAVPQELTSPSGGNERSESGGRSCQSATLPPLDTVGRVDLQRFLGDWYVIAHIPT